MKGIVEVKLWGTTIGYLGYPPDQHRIAVFEYDEEFALAGIPVSPITMKYPPAIHYFDNISLKTFKGLPGIFADSLPDKFGNQLIDIYMSEKKIPVDEITALDRLLYIGTRSMGALEYQPAADFGGREKIDTALDIHTLAELADMAASKQKNKHTALLKAGNRNKAFELIRIGSSAGGARAKALVALSPEGRYFDGTVDRGIEYSYWIIKFDSNSNSDRDNIDPKGMTRIEYIYSRIAGECGINIPKTGYIENEEEFHFLIRRFDRFPRDGKVEKLHYASWAGLTHADRDTTGAYSYEQLVLLARMLELGQDTVTEIFRRAVFNIIGRNQDDHTKNFGFLMNKKGEWSLAPAFDLTYAFDPKGKWTRVHQIKLNRKQDKFAKDDLLEFGKYCNLDRKKADRIISDVKGAFLNFRDYVRKYRVPSKLAETVWRNLRINI